MVEALVQGEPWILEDLEWARPVGHMVLCGDDALTEAIAHELRNVYGQDVRVIHFDRARGHGEQGGEAWSGGANWAARVAGHHPLAGEMIQAGVESASTFGVVMDDPREVLPTALLALQLNPGIRLVLRSEDPKWFSSLGERLGHEGAISLVAPSRQAGFDIVSRFFDLSKSLVISSGLTLFSDARRRAERSSRERTSVPIALVDDTGEVSLLPLDPIVEAAGTEERVVELHDRPPTRGRLPKSGHVVLVGLGRAGTGVLEALLNHGVRVVVVDRDPSAYGLTLAAHRSVPIVVGDARLPEVLEAADVDVCDAVVAVTGQWTVNMDVGWAAHARRPQLRVAVRDDREADTPPVRIRPLPAEFRTYGVLRWAASSFASAMAGRQLRAIPVQRRVLLLIERPVEEFGAQLGSTVEEAFRPGKWRLVALRDTAFPGTAWVWNPPPETNLGGRRLALVIATRSGARELLAPESGPAANPRNSSSGATPSHSAAEEEAGLHQVTGRPRTSDPAGSGSGRSRALGVFAGMLALATAVWCVLRILPTGRGPWWTVTLIVVWVVLAGLLVRLSPRRRSSVLPSDHMVTVRLSELYAALGPPPEPDDGHGAQPDPGAQGPGSPWPAGFFRPEAEPMDTLGRRS